MKKLQNMKWKSVTLDGFPVSDASERMNGFIGLEECTEYGMASSAKKSKKKNPVKKRKLTPSNVVPAKKIRLENGFVVEDCENIKPTCFNESTIKNNDTENVKSKIMGKKLKMKLGDKVCEDGDALTTEDMTSWLQFEIPNEIMKALAEQGFKRPTRIQELTLPTAMFGRRDILGAAETGSGKTLAFGIPILAGIMKLKEKHAAGIDIYDLPYKKTSAKRKNNIKPKKDKSKYKYKARRNNTKKTNGYASSSDDEEVKLVQNNKLKPNCSKINGNDRNGDSDDDDISSNENSSEEIDKDTSENEINSNSETDSDIENVESDVDNDILQESNSENEYVKDITIPYKKKPQADEDSDDSENYVHLSEMLDDDESSDDGNNKKISLNDNGEESDGEDDDGSDHDENDPENDNESSNDENEPEDDSNEQGIGCVKVVDDIALPDHVMVKTGKPLYCLILTPTRELAIQISRHLIAAAKYTGIRIAVLVGGMAHVKQERVLSRSPEVVVATPGRLWELIQQGEPHLQQLDNIKFLAIDETDRMVERNHFEELHPLLERLNADETRKTSRQNFVFSATLTMVHDLPKHMKGKKVTKRGKVLHRKVEKMTPQQKINKLVNMIGMTDPKVVDITTQNLGTAETLTECRITCSLEQKDYYLHYLLKTHPGRTIIFCNSIGSVKRLGQLFSLLNCRPLPLHASMPQRQRLKNLERFRDDKSGVLVATDVAARGLDIPDVHHVIHYQVPRTAENYVHRSGRTARANKEGITILMMEPGETHLYAKLCRTLNKQSEIPTFPIPPDVLTSMKQVVDLARDVERLQLSVRKTTQHEGWLNKAAKDMDILVDEDFMPNKSTDTKGASKALQIKKKHLENLLSKPVFPKGFSFKYPTLNKAEALEQKPKENALDVMKKALETGSVKKQKRTSKNAPLLRLEKKDVKKKKGK